MDSVAFFWTIIATLTGGLFTFTNKVTAARKYNPVVNTFFSCAIPTLFAAGALIIFGMPEYSRLTILGGVISGILYAFAGVLRIQALHYVDSAIFFPLYKIIQPLLIVIGGVSVLSEQLHSTQYLGVAVGMLVPLMLIDSKEHHRQNNLKKGIELLLVTTVLTTIGTLGAKIALPDPAHIFLFLFVAQGVGVVVTGYKLLAQKIAITDMPTPELWFGFVTGVLEIASLYSLSMALSLGYVSLVYTIHAHYILIPIFLSVWFYKEHMSIRKFAAVVLSVVAIGLLY